jgi:hypothetical protein
LNLFDRRLTNQYREISGLGNDASAASEHIPLSGAASVERRPFFFDQP